MHTYYICAYLYFYESFLWGVGMGFSRTICEIVSASEMRSCAPYLESDRLVPSCVIGFKF